MSAPVLKVEGLGKAFREYGAEWRRIATWFGVAARATSEAWVLRNVAFQVFAGESVGIVGQNGAGKSTLLKLVTGTLRPTEGSIAVNGRIAAILELGMGFNADLTGRENARYTAGLMGMSPEQIDAIIPEVEAFAEIGGYFDQPLRTYSSGMQMRVAFSVVTAVRPEILIIDEALSVGDAYFAHKSMARIRRFREEGTTLLFVSHDPGAIQSLCDRAILLDHGRLLLDGEPRQVMDYYNALIAERENATVEVRQLGAGAAQTISGTREAVVESIGLFNAAGAPVEFVNVGEPVELRVRIAVHDDIPRLVFGYMVKDRLGQPVFGTNTHHTGQPLEGVRKGAVVEYRVAFPMNFGPGSYSVSTALCSTDTHLVNNYEWRDLALVFTVANQDRDSFIGTAWVPPVIEVRVS
ncbi:MAG: O-antigen export system, ATP-binding protein [Rhodanobacteraceae bacterium]|nr:MAG: O-antigen export system, ATP-binding protein [Rhodanobacteraceae bacterium]